MRRAFHTQCTVHSTCPTASHHPLDSPPQVGEVITIKLCSRDPAPPPFEYVKGGGGLFKDMAVHDLDMVRPR